MSGVNFGLFCSTPSVALSRNVPASRRSRCCVTGEFIRADEARATGLVNRVAAPDALDARGRGAGRQRSSPSRASAIALGKALFYRQIEKRHRRGLRRSPAATMACNMMDEAALEGVQAFIDKRKPDWPT